VVVTDHDPALETIVTILRILKQQRNEGLDFKNLKKSNGASSFCQPLRRPLGKYLAGLT
jgi:hypothetical protein